MTTSSHTQPIALSDPRPALITRALPTIISFAGPATTFAAWFVFVYLARAALS